MFVLEDGRKNIVWQWWSKSGGWKDYSSANSKCIEAAYQREDEQLEIDTEAGAYQVNLNHDGSGYQHPVGNPDLTRKIQRKLQTGEAPHLVWKGPRRKDQGWRRSSASRSSDSLLAFDPPRRMPPKGLWRPPAIRDLAVEDGFNPCANWDWRSLGQPDSSVEQVDILPAVLASGKLLPICQAARCLMTSAVPSELAKQVLEAMRRAAQKLVTATFLNVWTHDRPKKSKFDSECQNVPKKLKVKSVELVGTNAMRSRYQEVRKQVMRDSKGTKKYSASTARWAADWHLISPEANEWVLFHGTSSEKASEIGRNNFELDKACTRSACGPGFYFAESSTKADEYASPDIEGTDRALVICRVLGGKVHYTDEEAPDRGVLQDLLQRGACHSIINDRAKCSGTFKEFVKVHPEHVLPECIIRYEQQP